MSNNNNNVHNKETEEQLIKSNKSMAQQNIELREEIKNLKSQLLHRESRLMSTINILNQVMEVGEKEVNKAHKHLQKDILELTNWVGEDLAALISSQMQKNENLSIEDQRKLSNQFRSSERLPLLDPTGEVIPSPR